MHLAYFEWKKWAIERAMLQKAEESMMIRNIMSTKRLQSFNELQENMEEQRDIIIQAQIERHLYDFGIDAMNGSIQLL